MEVDEEEDADEEELGEAWDDVRGGSLKYNEDFIFWVVALAVSFCRRPCVEHRHGDDMEHR